MRPALRIRVVGTLFCFVLLALRIFFLFLVLFSTCSPRLGDVVRLSKFKHDCNLTMDQVGWVVKDEKDHQPFLVRAGWNGKPYWYRESEVSG